MIGQLKHKQVVHVSHKFWDQKKVGNICRHGFSNVDTKKKKKNPKTKIIIYKTS
jgi:hypothetical protein